MDGTSPSFFDRIAPSWDRRIQRRDTQSAERLVKRIPICAGDAVLDVGSGTGIMIPFYRSKGARDITAMDSSPVMTGILAEKFPGLKIRCQSFLEPVRERASKDKVVIFNAFPHLSNFEKAFVNAWDYLKDRGMLVIAHSMSREELNDLHRRKHEVRRDVLPDGDYFHLKLIEYGFSGILVEDGFKGFTVMACKDS